ncbi:hypothetical protein GQ43DRAFT_412724 [Delitschia confertaspora ATCC 74209]|uniref:Zn(2)-C6 fungal-type domain-containing protein n=1 Tax=Delitschia confertaspora ATCC 74209 TaxID=1513339 RepID=A0A9P4JPL4_9PLEO|nr:hypothetical protein GQ43DRAFT_412724 [Delitschia confertaspora ATCC 74209]
MPKARTTCVRCSMRRQKCDRKIPCSRCIQNNESHICTREWPNGYNPEIHRKYPSRSATSQEPPNWSTPPISDHEAAHPPSSNIDFATFGRSEYSDISLNTLLTDNNPYASNRGPIQPQNTNSTSSTNTSITLSSPARSAESYHIQSLLPARRQVFLMVDYYDSELLYWTGGTYHAPTFRQSLLQAYGTSSTLNLQEQDWQWSALLFSILSGSIIGSPATLSSSWGYSSSDKIRLTKPWARATISCLLLGDYASKFHIYSVQAMINLHSSEHLIGFSKEFVVYQGAARQALIKREIGRRVWFSLCFQDWLFLPPQGYIRFNASILLQLDRAVMTRPA